MICNFCGNKKNVLGCVTLKKDIWKLPDGSIEPIASNSDVIISRLEFEVCDKCREIIFRNSCCCIHFSNLLARYVLKGGNIDMTIREPKQLLPTMKLDPTDENDLEFKECEATILDIRDIKTSYGDKVVMSLQNNDDETKFEVFVNNSSITELGKGFGKDDTAWKGKSVKITKDRNKRFKKDMIVLIPVK